MNENDELYFELPASDMEQLARVLSLSARELAALLGASEGMEVGP